ERGDVDPELAVVLLGRQRLFLGGPLEVDEGLTVGAQRHGVLLDGGDAGDRPVVVLDDDLAAGFDVTEGLAPGVAALAGVPALRRRAPRVVHVVPHFKRVTGSCHQNVSWPRSRAHPGPRRGRGGGQGREAAPCTPPRLMRPAAPPRPAAPSATRARWRAARRPGGDAAARAPARPSPPTSPPRSA